MTDLVIDSQRAPLRPDGPGWELTSYYFDDETGVGHYRYTRGRGASRETQKVTRPEHPRHADHPDHRAWCGGGCQHLNQENP